MLGLARAGQGRSLFPRKADLPRPATNREARAADQAIERNVITEAIVIRTVVLLQKSRLIEKGGSGARRSDVGLSSGRGEKGTRLRKKRGPMGLKTKHLEAESNSKMGKTCSGTAKK